MPSALAEQAAAELEQIADAQLPIAVLVQHGGQQSTTVGALRFLAESLAELTRVGVAAAGEALGEIGHDDGGEDGQQLAGLAAVQPGGLAQALGGTVSVATEDMAEDAGTVGGIAATAAQHAAEQPAQIEAAGTGRGMITLQRPEQCLGALRFLRIAAHRAEQQGQGSADRGAGLVGVDAQLLGHLLQALALLQLLEEGRGK